MAIQFKTEEQKKIEKANKAPKTKLEKAQKALFISSIVSEVILFLFFIVCFARGLIILPLLVFWLLAVLIPTACTAGIVWTSEGYRNFIKNLNDLVGKSGDAINKIADTLLKGLPYVSTTLILVIAAYGVLSFISYKKNKENKKYLHHFIAACIMFALGLFFTIVAFIALGGS